MIQTKEDLMANDHSRVLKGDALSPLEKYSSFSLSWSRKRSLGKKRWKKNPFSNLLAHSRPKPGKHINRRPAPLAPLPPLCSLSAAHRNLFSTHQLTGHTSPLLAPLLDLARGKVKVARLCPTVCDPVDYIIHGILQARILEWVAVPFSRGSSQARDKNHGSHVAGRFFTSWATKEAQLEGSPWLILSKQFLFTALDREETKSEGEGSGVTVSILYRRTAAVSSRLGPLAWVCIARRRIWDWYAKGIEAHLVSQISWINPDIVSHSLARSASEGKPST